LAGPLQVWSASSSSKPKVDSYLLDDMPLKNANSNGTIYINDLTTHIRDGAIIGEDIGDILFGGTVSKHELKRPRYECQGLRRISEYNATVSLKNVQFTMRL